MKITITRRAGLLALAGCAASLTAACMATYPAAQQPHHAQLAPDGSRQCFLASQVSGFTPIGRDRVQVKAGGDTFELQTSGNCRDIAWSRDIVMRSTSGSNWICNGLDAELLVPSVTRSGGFDRCLVGDMRLLTPQEIEASRAQRRR